MGKATWGMPEVKAMLGGWAGPRTPADARESLSRALGQLGYGDGLFLVSRGSLALRLALDEMRVQRPARGVVAVPAYCCPSVPDTVRDMGLSVRAAPVLPDLNLDLSRLPGLLGPDVLAVVGVHMYALPLDMARLKAITDATGAYLIDDAAHVVGNGRKPPGTAGAAGLLSFNQSKTLTGGSPNGGGVLIVGDEQLRRGIAARYAALREGVSRARNYIWFVLRFGIERTPRALLEYLHPFDEPLPMVLGVNSKIAERMSASACLVVAEQLKRLREIVDGRTRVVAHYIEALRANPVLSFVQGSEPRYLSRVLVRWNEGPPADQVRERLLKRGFAARLPYPLWTSPDDPTAGEIVRINATHLELPASPRLTSAEIDELVSAVTLCVNSAAAK